MRTITISNGLIVDMLHAQIQQQLPLQFNNVSFYLCVFYPGPVRYKYMHLSALISNYFERDTITGIPDILVQEE